MRQGIVPPRRDQQGFTLVEVMVAALVLMVGVLGTYVMIDGAQRQTRENNARTAITTLAREVLEQTRTLEYEDIKPAGLVDKLRAKGNLAGTVRADGKWQITRRNIPVTLSLSVCTYDDPMDGKGNPAPANPCPSAATVDGTTADSNPDDFRRVTVTLSWTRGTRTHEIVQTSQINNPGGGLGPRIRIFNDPYPGQVDATTALPSSRYITFNATSTFASTVRWSVDDGLSAGDALAGTGAAGESWTWNWDVGVVKMVNGVPVNDGTWKLDGVYTANAQPFDDRGVPGEMRVVSVTLNRLKPIPPSSFNGGRSQTSSSGSGSGNVVELDWSPNPERDVLGYRVYRVDSNGSETQVNCAGSGSAGYTTATSCTDTNPPSTTSTTYRVRAVDRAIFGDPGSTPRDGFTSEKVVGALSTVNLDRPVIDQAIVKGGRPYLHWAAPTNGTVAFYRIYRDGVRIARTIDATPEFTDTDFGSTTSHIYTVSAVEPTYREGKLSDPVTTPAS